MNACTFRAAYWTDGANDILLTDEGMAGMPDSELLAEAIREAEKIGLDVGEGKIVIDTCTVSGAYYVSGAHYA